MQPFQCTRAGTSSSSASLRPTTNAANFTRRSYGQNRLSLMMSRKLTSGFNFRSCDHHHMAVMPMSIKFSENSRSHPRFPDRCRPSLDLCISVKFGPDWSEFAGIIPETLLFQTSKVIKGDQHPA